MSFRGGRGGRAGRDSGRPQLFGSDLKPDFTPSELYPTFELPMEAVITEFEKQSVNEFLQHQHNVHDSAFYVTEKKKGIVEYEGGINDGIARYSDRYLKRRKVGKAVTDHPYIVEFFPQELYSTIGVKSSLSKTDIAERRKLNLAKHRDDIAAEEAYKAGANDDDAANVDDEAGLEDDADAEDGQEDLEEDEEDEFEEDEDGDYNAEKYFDDGEDEYDDGGGDDEAAY